MNFEARYWLEMHTGTTIKAFLLPHVSDYTPELRPSTVIRWGLAGDRPRTFNAGFRSGSVRVTGKSGLKDRRATTATGAVGTISGLDHFRELEAFVISYQKEVTKYENAFTQDRTRSPRLVFRASWEGHHFYVTTPRLRPLRGPGTRMFYGYSLDLEVIGLYEFSPDRPMAGEEAFAYRDQVAVETKAAEASAAVTVASGAEAEQTATAPVAWGQGVAVPTATGTNWLSLRPIHEVIAEVEGLADKARQPLHDYQSKLVEISGAADRAQGVGKLSARLAADAVRASEQTVTTIMDAAKLVRLPWDATKLAYYSAIQAAEAVEDACSALYEAVVGEEIKALADPANQTISLAGPEISAPAQELRTVILLPGESIFDLAWRVLGSHERWEEIASLNEISDPLMLADGSPIAGGVSLLVPGSAGSDYGTDARWSFDADDFVISPLGDDIASISGADNLLQGLSRRARTVRGEIPVFDSYGLRPVDEASTPGSLGEIASDINMQFRLDRRVADVRKILVEQSGDRLTAKFEVYPVESAPFLGAAALPQEG